MRAQHVFTLEATYQTYIVGPHTRMSIARCKDDMQQICTRYFTVTLSSHLSRQGQRHQLHSSVAASLLTFRNTPET